MKTFIVLLRGINVGGKKALPVNELVGLLERIGCRDVRTYIRSGPDGVARSKLAASSEKLLGVWMTDRNWRTVGTLRDMAEELAP